MTLATELASSFANPLAKALAKVVSIPAPTHADLFAGTFNADGFTINATDTQVNASGGTYHYMAFR